MKAGDIGKHIATLREEKGYSQKELAEAIPVTQPTLSRWENGTIIPPLQQLERVCEVLGIPLEQIFPGNKEEYNRLRAKLTRTRIVAAVLLAVILFIGLIILIPKYRVVCEGEVYPGDYGETLTVYVIPLFFINESGADAYGRKLFNKYEGRKDFDVFEIIFVKSKEDLSIDNSLLSFLYFRSSSEN